jgi:hypothetical protein
MFFFAAKKHPYTKFLTDSLFFQRCCVAKDAPGSLNGRCPAYSVGNYALYLGIVVGWYCLMAWAEIKDFATAPAIAGTTTEDLTAAKPANEN